MRSGSPESDRAEHCNPHRLPMSACRIAACALELDGVRHGCHKIAFSAIAASSAVVGATGEHSVGRLGRSRAQWGGMTGMAAGVALVGLAPHIAISLLGALLMGGLGTLALIANQAALADLHGSRREVALTESNVVATSTADMAPLLIGAFSAPGLPARAR